MITAEEKGKLKAEEQRQNINSLMSVFEHSDVSDNPYEWTVYFDGKLYRGWATAAHRAFFEARNKINDLKYKRLAQKRLVGLGK